MCELLVVCASEPVRLTFSLHTLAARGALPATTRDGWGVAFYQGLDVALFREPGAASDSPLVRFLETDGPSTRMAISHIRHATQGAVQLSNTQPFARSLGGRTHVFAHNGHLPGIGECGSLALGRHRPVGQTDSEHAFCALLERLEALWQGPVAPTVQARCAVLAGFAADLRVLGPANFVYCDADAVFVHGDRAHPAVLGPHRAAGTVALPAALPAGRAASRHRQRRSGCRQRAGRSLGGQRPPHRRGLATAGRGRDGGPAGRGDRRRFRTMPSMTGCGITPVLERSRPACAGTPRETSGCAPATARSLPRHPARPTGAAW